MIQELLAKTKCILHVYLFIIVVGVVVAGKMAVGFARILIPP